MKFICLGYMEEKKWDAMSQSERDAMMKECFAYDDVLRKKGYFIGGEALQSARNATTLRWQNGKVSVTDSPFAATKEQLGGILVLEAKDLNHAIQLMSKHPGVRLGGGFEIRPTEDIGLPDRLRRTHSQHQRTNRRDDKHTRTSENRAARRMARCPQGSAEQEKEAAYAREALNAEPGRSRW